MQVTIQASSEKLKKVKLKILLFYVLSNLVTCVKRYEKLFRLKIFLFPSKVHCWRNFQEKDNFFILYFHFLLLLNSSQII
jgi:hypothetical protein